MNFIKAMGALFLVSGMSATSYAQHTLTTAQQQDKMVAGKIWKPFVLTGSYNTFSKGTFDFSSHKKPVFLYVGQKACIICAYEFPTYAQMAKEFPGIDFVYLTPDGASDIETKFGKNLQTANLFVIPFPMQQLWDKDIAKVFPVKYFIGRNGIVVDAATGGTTKNREQLRKKWESKLRQLEKKTE